MAAIAELPQPGVKVIQEYTASAPTIVVPTLAPVIVGACYEINELTDTDGALNAEILVSGPAIATAPNDDASYTAMSAKTLLVRVSGGPIQTFTMPATASLTATQVAAAINGASVAPVGFAAYVYQDVASDDFLQLRTTASGSNVTLTIVGGTLLDAPNQLGWGKGYTYYGLGTYIQDQVYLKQESFPDPLDIGDERDIIEASIRVFVDLSTESREILRTESFLRGDNYNVALNYGVMAVDDGDGDQTTPYVKLLGTGGAIPNLLAAPGSAVVTSTVVDYTADLLDINNKTLILQLNGSGKQTVVFQGDPVVSEAVGALIPYTGTITMTVNGVTGVAVSVVAAGSLAALVTAINTDAGVVALGVGSIAFAADANGNAGATHLGLLVGANPLAPVDNSDVKVTAETGAALFLAPSLPYQQTLQIGGAGPRDTAWGQINNVMGVTLGALSATNMTLTSATSGYESKIEIDSLSTALTALGLAAGSTYGAPFVTRVGDYLYGNGTLVGMVTEVHAGGVSGRLKLDREVLLTLTAKFWYIISKNLDTVVSTQWGVSVPIPDLRLDTNGDVLIKHDFLRDTGGAPVGVTSVNAYCMYSALRTDVSPAAASPALLSFSDYDDLEAALPPVTPDNPLSYGLYVAMQNCPGCEVYGTGVSAISADAPYGTTAAFSSALDFLESKEVYGIACMTSEPDVASILYTHVEAMSEPDQKMERIGVIHLGLPTSELSTIVISGSDGDYVAGPAFDTKMASLSAALLAEGIDPTNITVSDGVFLDIAEDDYKWNITGPLITGTTVSINTTFAAGENDDAYYATGTFPITLVSETFSVSIRGAAITTKAKEVETVYNRGQSFSSRRIWMVQCDELRASVDGVDSAIEGFYGCAAKVGMVAGLNPALPMTNRSIAVFTGVTGTKDRYKNSELNQMAAGGADLIIQDSAGASCYSRMQVTTKLTSIAEREQSVVKAVDYCAKFYRATLRRYIGSYNITQSFLDTLSAVTEALSRWLVEEGKVVAGANMSNLLQDSVQTDTVLADISLTMLYPNNYLQITLLI